MLTTVHCSHNMQPIVVTIRHVDGKDLRFTIQKGQALIDKNGYVRFFTLDWGTNETEGYKLHPYQTQTQKGVHWVLEFLAGFGLSRLGSRVVKGKTHIENLGRYFTFSNPGGQAIRSFIPESFGPEHLGYHNINSDKLIFLGPIRV